MTRGKELARLLGALRLTSGDWLTWLELGHALGVSDRQARRLIAALRDLGIVVEQQRDDEGRTRVRVTRLAVYRWLYD